MSDRHSLSDLVPEALRHMLPEAHRGVSLGKYQADVIYGHALPSGADLQGRARHYGARYARSRAVAIARVNDALTAIGVPIWVTSEIMALGRPDYGYPVRARRVLVWYVAGMRAVWGIRGSPRVREHVAPWVESPGSLAGGLRR